MQITISIFFVCVFKMNSDLTLLLSWFAFVQELEEISPCFSDFREDLTKKAYFLGVWENNCYKIRIILVYMLRSNARAWSIREWSKWKIREINSVFQLCRPIRKLTGKLCPKYEVKAIRFVTLKCTLYKWQERMFHAVRIIFWYAV